MYKDWHHAPPPGARSGVADYAETLDRAFAAFPRPAFDLYHLGNNALHSAIYARALAKPGIAILHDAVLHHFLLGTLSRDKYIAEFVHNYGEWRRHLAEELWAERASSGVDPRYFRFAMLRRAVENSRAVVVHNPGAARIAREHGAQNVHVIPHFYVPAPLPDRAETARFRQRLGIGQGTALFGIFGYLRETKRILPCIRAFRKLHAARPDTALLLAGDPVSGDLRRVLEAEAQYPAIHRLGHLTEADLRTATATIDCCLNLRYPAAGETSGIAIRMMGAGKPVIVTEGEENADIPEAACLRVASGVAEGPDLFNQMALVTGFPQVARDIGALARRHILEHHAPEKAVDRYRQVLFPD